MCPEEVVKMAPLEVLLAKVLPVTDKRVWVMEVVVGML